MFWKPCGLLVLAASCHLYVLSADLNAQGVATGWVVANAGEDASGIAPGENSTQVFTGLNVISSSSSSDGAVDTESSFPDVKVSVDSMSIGSDKVAYGGAYFEDSITILGGSGSFEMSMRWDFDGGISGAGGEFSVGPNPGIGARSGSAAANFRVFVEPFGHSTLDLTDTDLFKDVALEPSGELEVPFFDPFGEGGNTLELPGFNSVSNFVFDSIVNGEPTDDFIEAWYTDTNADSLAFLGGGASFTWEYGVPLEYGVLLEGWAANGGAVDFFNTGTFTQLLLPNGATVDSEGGATYDVVNAVPEPSAAIALLIGLIGVSGRRRRFVA